MAGFGERRWHQRSKVHEHEKLWCVGECHHWPANRGCPHGIYPQNTGKCYFMFVLSLFLADDCLLVLWLMSLNTNFNVSLLCVVLVSCVNCRTLWKNSRLVRGPLRMSSSRHVRVLPLLWPRLVIFKNFGNISYACSILMIQTICRNRVPAFSLFYECLCDASPLHPWPRCSSKLIVHQASKFIHCSKFQGKKLAISENSPNFFTIQWCGGACSLLW